ncbi:MAG: ABC transporter permease subunit [Sedimentisphaerales bacterium]|nr:ABC transporter permease subunit [Sedimentisphaerales bacterium]
MYRLLTIAKNTFTETLRQPIYLIIIEVALLMMLISPSLATYTLDEEQDLNLLREIALSTLFLAGLFISIFAATGAVTEEIETGTITTVLSKPVSRPVFILGKFFGITAAILLAHYIGTLGLMLTVRHGVLFEAADTHDWTVVIAAAFTLLGSFAVSAFLNYTYDWNFPSTLVITTALFGTFGFIFLFFIDREWAYNPTDNKFTLFEVNASILLLLAIIILVALSVLFSTRCNVIVTLSCVVGLFLLGLISDYVFGRFVMTNILARFVYILVPNLQVFWTTDTIYTKGFIPVGYIFKSAIYTLLYSSGILGLAIALFQKRQIG